MEAILEFDCFFFRVIDIDWHVVGLNCINNCVLPFSECNEVI